MAEGLNCKIRPLDARLHNPRGTVISLRGIYDRLENCPARFRLLLTNA